jgi:D-alanine-D-alanine ligase
MDPGKSGRIWVNEINTMPGFTSISMYPRLWAASGVPYPKLIDRLIQLAMERREDKDRNRYSL